MARRSKSSFKPAYIALPLLIAGLGVGGVKFLKGTHKGFDGVATLSPRDYLNNNASVQGNTYQIVVTVGERIHATDAGRLYALTAKDGSETIPMTGLFSDKFASENVQVGQELVLKVQVDRTGVLRVQEIKRS